MVTDSQTHTDTNTPPARHRQDRLQYTALLSLARSVTAGRRLCRSSTLLFIYSIAFRLDHVITLSNSGIRSLPILLFSGIVTCMMSFCKEFPGFLITCPKYCKFYCATLCVYRRGLCCRPMSVHLSVTFVYCIHTAEDVVTLLSQPVAHHSGFLGSTP